MRIGVLGAAGRMGQTVCEAVSGDSDLELVAQLDIGDSIDELKNSECDVVVDFTQADSARQNLLEVASYGIHAVVGTTGLNDDDIKNLDGAFTNSSCLIVPNFAIGAVLMMQFAQQAAPYFESAEVIELHHNKKVDAPSGTAMETVKRMAEASSDLASDPTEKETLPDARGAEHSSGIRIHSVRLQGLVAHQEVLLGTTGQSLSIRHDTYDRTAFMPGVLLAVKNVAKLPTGVTTGLEQVL
jgi:4-hydroxy-tetrahydrodipicolinate reductase